MFYFKVDVKEFNKMIPFCGTYLDVIFRSNKVVICSSSGQSYIQYLCNGVSTNPSEGESVRIDTAIFSKLVLGGKVEVIVHDAEVSFTFFNENGKSVYSVTVPKQCCYNDLDHKLDLIFKCDESTSYSLAGVTNLVKIASRLKVPFISNEGFCYSNYNKNYLFKKMDLPSFCVDSELLSKSLSITDSFYVIGDNLIMKNGPVAIVISKQKLPFVCDLPYIVGLKANRHVRLDLSNLFSLLYKIKITRQITTKVNIDAERCFVLDEVNRFEVPIELISDSKKEQSLENMLNSLESGLDSTPSEKNNNVLILPYWISKVMDRVSLVDVYVTKRFCIAKFNGINLTIGGSLLEE